jgi:nucleotide-binding universal stress UspA family protein
MPSVETLIVPIDFSETSVDALHLACELAQTTRGSVHLLHVIPDPLQQPWITQTGGVDYFAMEKGWRDDAMRQLKELAARTDLPAGAATVAVRAGKPAEAILAYADEQGADLIVMGAHGESAVVRFFLGSVAERVVRHATVPVLTVPCGCAVARSAAPVTRDAVTTDTVTTDTVTADAVSR